MIGVHTPEFSFEHEVDGVRRATTERGIDYPVAVDNDYAIWSAFDNSYWPALYFIDREGVVRDQHFGEGRYEQSERVIQELLGVKRKLAAVDPRGVEAQDDWALAGEWTVGRENVVMDRGVGASPSGFSRATQILSCPLARGRQFRSACFWMARHPAGHTAWTSTMTGTVYSETPACINCCASTRRYASGRWKSRSSSVAPRRTRSRSGRARHSRSRGGDHHGRVRHREPASERVDRRPDAVSQLV